MATTDKAQFLRILRDAEQEMDDLFAGLARDIGQAVMRAAGPDGQVPVGRLQALQAEVARIVDRAFLGGAKRRPFDDENQPLAAFPQLIAQGQRAQIDVVLERQARLLQQYLPDDLREAITRWWQQGGG